MKKYYTTNDLFIYIFIYFPLYHSLDLSEGCLFLFSFFRWWSHRRGGIYQRLQHLRSTEQRVQNRVRQIVGCKYRGGKKGLSYLYRELRENVIPNFSRSLPPPYPPADHRVYKIRVLSLGWGFLVLIAKPFSKLSFWQKFPTPFSDETLLR